MNRSKSKVNKVLVILLVVNLILTAGIICYLASGNSGGADEPGESKYTIYIGTNDKDTYRQEIPTEQAREIVNGICSEHAEGFTSVDAAGYWTDETDAPTREDSFVYSFYGIDEETLRDIMDDILIELNQNSILVEHETVESTYYSGRGQ